MYFGKTSDIQLNINFSCFSLEESIFQYLSIDVVLRVDSLAAGQPLDGVARLPRLGGAELLAVGVQTVLTEPLAEGGHTVRGHLYKHAFHPAQLFS